MKFFKKSDVIFVTVILIVSFLLWAGLRFLPPKSATRAEIYYKTDLVETVDLHTGKDRLFSVPGHENVVFHLFEDGKISFEQSDCPDKVCIHTGKLDRTGQTAACLPNEMILKIVSDKEPNEDDLDIIVGR